MWQRKKLLRVAGIACLALLLLGSGFTLYLDQRVRTEFEGRRFALPARIYARPLELHAGLRIAQPDLEDELRQLGYLDTPRPDEFGWFSRSGERLEIALRPFMFWDGAQPAKRVRLAVEDGVLKELRDADGAEVPLVR